MRQTPSRPLTLWGCASLAALVSLTGCSSSDGPALDGINANASYEAVVRRTDGGVAHIQADDFSSLGYGTGYAMAQDNICLIANQMLSFSAERSRFLGPQDGNLQSDFFYRLFIDRKEAEEPVDARQAAVFRGAAAGYNRYLRDTGLDQLPDASCRGKPWVRELAEIDFRRISRMNFFYPNLLNQIVGAVPPAATQPVVSAPLRRAEPGAAAAHIEAAIGQLLEPFKNLGSNGIALGRDATAGGTGMLLANPHQPWNGTSRFWAFHQTLPGELDVIGANVIGRPQVGIGATEHISWTATVQTGPLFTFYQQSMVPGQPTQYLFDGAPRPLKAETVTVQALEGGALVPRSHTFYSTHYGALMVGGSTFPWTGNSAYSVRAVDAGWRSIEALLPQYQAKSVQEYKAVQDKYQYNPSNVIAADSSGNAFYMNAAPIPNLTDAQRSACARPGGLDGSRSACMWNSDPDAAIPGIFGPSKMPSITRTDHASNMNDSYWLANPAEPLYGFDSSLGSIDSARTPRTRSGLAQIAERIAGTDGLPGSKFTREQLQDLAFSNVAYMGRILRDDLVTLCQKNPVVTVAGAAVDLRAACAVLAAWDLHDNLDSRGAHLFREFAALSTERNYRVPFDLKDPVNTPRSLDTDNNPAVLQALAGAVQKLTAAGIALDARLGDIQYVTRNGQRIPLHGGTNPSGNLNIIGAPFAGAAGYPNVASGTSWVQVTEFTNAGPKARGVLAYSQSTNPDSPHYSDMTRAYSDKRWIELPFKQADVAAAAVSTLQLTEGAAQCDSEGWKRFGNPVFTDQAQCSAHFKTLRETRLREIRDRRSK